MMKDLEGCSLADVLERLEKGKIGHGSAMEWLNIESVDDLVEIMHANGRLMPGHQPMLVSPETTALVRAITRPAAVSYEPRIDPTLRTSKARKQGLRGERRIPPNPAS